MSPTPPSWPVLSAPSATGQAPRVAQALLSLQNSRLALRAELLPPAQRQPRARSPQGLARLWWRRLRQVPAARLLADSARAWWRRHPWHPVAETLADEVHAQLVPAVRRHPWASMGVALLGGAALAALRPWRWPWLAQRLHHAPRQASGWLMRQLASAPVQAALVGLIGLALQRSQAAAAAAAAACAAPEGDAPQAHPPATPSPAPGATVAAAGLATHPAP